MEIERTYRISFEFEIRLFFQPETVAVLILLCNSDLCHICKVSSDRNAIQEYKALLACFAVTGDFYKPIPQGGYNKVAQLSGMGEREAE